MARYVSIPADRLVGTLDAIGSKVEEVGGGHGWGVQGREKVFDLHTPSRGVVRVFTSLAVGATAARSCGADAVRVVPGVIDDGKFYPTAKSRRLFRTAPQDGDRVKAFLDRLTAALRDAYKEATRRVQTCPDCGSTLVYRKGKNGAFLGCSTYPKCRKTQQIA